MSTKTLSEAAEKIASLYDSKLAARAVFKSGANYMAEIKDAEILELTKEISRLRLALEFYADGRHYTEKDSEIINIIPGNDEFQDHIPGKRAREALTPTQKVEEE